MATQRYIDVGSIPIIFQSLRRDTPHGNAGGPLPLSRGHVSFNRSGAIPLMATLTMVIHSPLTWNAFNRSGAIPLMATYERERVNRLFK